jgi:cell division protein FtsW
MRRLQQCKIDKILFGIVVFLVVYGLLVLASSSLIKSQKLFQENYYYLKHQLIFGALIGFGFFFLGAKLKYTLWRKLSVAIFLLSLLLLFLPFIPSLGVRLGGARRWVNLGGLVFQPSEFVKLGFILYLSVWLSQRTKEINAFSKTIFPFLFLNALLGIFFFLQPDFGSLLVIYICSFSLFILAGIKLRYLATIIAVGVVLLAALIYFSPYRFARVTAFLHPEKYALESSYQVRQALIAMGSGGIMGQGYGQSFQKRGYLPENIGDSIFAVLVEELGFVGGIVLLMAFLVLAFKGIWIAKRAPDSFSQFLAAGIVCLIVYQAFINIAAISGMIPLTGLTLPLVSYGSSSYVITLFSLGILMNISCYARHNRSIAHK